MNHVGPWLCLVIPAGHESQFEHVQTVLPNFLFPTTWSAGARAHAHRDKIHPERTPSNLLCKRPRVSTGCLSGRPPPTRDGRLLLAPCIPERAPAQQPLRRLAPERGGEHTVGHYSFKHVFRAKLCLSLASCSCKYAHFN